MRLVKIDHWPIGQEADYRPELETGNVLFFPATPFALPEQSREFLRNLNFTGGALHKNIAYRPASDRVTGMEGDGAGLERLRSIMRDYSRAVIEFTSKLLPGYAGRWSIDYASFRPLKEQGRGLPVNKRNDLIHTDAFPSRPTNGGMILRVFTNIHPSKTRHWVTTDPFPEVAARYAREAGLERIARSAALPSRRLLNRCAGALQALGLPAVQRSPYDRFMLRFHEYLKRNAEFQANSPKYHFEFSPGSTWLIFTDLVPHSVQSGQHALEQTFIIAPESLADPERAPVAVLEQICRRPLAMPEAFMWPSAGSHE
jgi:hypothetical protein